MTDTEVGDSLTPLLRGDRPTTWAYADVSADREDPRGWADSLATATLDALVQAGATVDDARVLAEELVAPLGVPAPVSRYVLVQGGEVVLSEVLPGRRRPLTPSATAPCPTRCRCWRTARST